MPQLQHEFCTVEGCKRPHKARGMCQTHYMQFKRGAPVVPEIKSRDRTAFECCKEDGCAEPVKSRGLCNMHYARLLRHGYTKYRDRKKPAKPCSVEGCSRHLYASGLCHRHYLQHQYFPSKYGITLEQYLQMNADQKMRCAICGTSAAPELGAKKGLAVDHCHETGVVRGLLCEHCNRALGLFRDSPTVLRKAAAYIDKHRK